LDSTDAVGMSSHVRKHETESNVYSKVILVKKRPALCLFAKQHIDAGEEIVMPDRDEDTAKVEKNMMKPLANSYAQTMVCYILVTF
jgi:hypothetical protein